MADEETESNAVEVSPKATKGVRKGTKRGQAPANKKSPVTKKSKVSPSKAKPKAVVTRTRSKARSQETPADETEVEAVENQDQEDKSSFETKETNGQTHKDNSGKEPLALAVNSSKLTVEERRKAIQAERLRKQKEMEDLLAEEAALAAAEEEHKKEEEPISSESLDALNNSADGYDTRSEIEDSHEDELLRDDEPEADDQFESMDEAPEVTHSGDESMSHDQTAEEQRETDQLDDEEKSHDQSAEDESHEPPVEGGLAGLDDDEEDDFGDDMVDTSKERAISPVTWDVDVRAEDEDNISVDSPLNSNDEASDTDGGEIEDEEEDKKKKPEVIKAPEIKPLMETVVPKPDRNLTIRPDSVVNPRSIEAAELLRPRVHKYLYREAKYYMVKSSNHENVRLAKAKGVWSTPPQNEIRFNRAVDENTTVILIFSVKESGAFQGFARINGPSQKDGPKINWVLPPGISAKALSGVFKLDWISRTDLVFPKTGHLRNPWNQHKPVKIARDGQELEPHIGEALCKLFTLDGSSDYERVISRVKRKREALQAKGPITKAPYRPSSSYNRDGGSDYRGRGRGSGPRGGGHRGSGRGGRGGYHDGPPRGSSYSRSMNNGPPPHGGSFPPPHSQYYTSGGRNDYNDYRGGRNSYPPGPGDGPYPPPPPHYYGGPHVSSDVIVKGSYEEYLDQIRRSQSFSDVPLGPMSMYDHYTPSYHTSGGRDGPPPPPIPSYTSSRDRDRDRDRDHRDSHRRSHGDGGSSRPSADRYDRAVEDFLRRTTGSSGGSRSSRGDYRDSRAEHRYKDPRDPRDSRDPRDHRRGRSRSRDRARERR